jgi:ribosome-binding factor A
VPTLTFVSDAVPKTAQDIEDALARAREIDAEVAAKRHGAAYAGEADPYKQPRADEDDASDEDDADVDDPDAGDRVTERSK